MPTNIEIEAKCLISENNYKKVLDLLESRKTNVVKNTNHYIDTDSFVLKDHGIGLRIRETDIFELTIKAPIAEGLLENKVLISKEQFDNFDKKGIFPDTSITEFIKMLNVDVNSLKIQAEMITERIEIKDFENVGTLCIDKNSYNGLVDYELELEGESMDKVKTKLKELCAKLNIPYKDNLNSKQRRALDTKK